MAEVGLQLVDHLAGAAGTLLLTQRQKLQVLQLRAGEQVRGAVRARGHACATADAGSVVERGLRVVVVHGQGVSVRRGAGVDRDVAALLHHAVQRGAVHGEVLDHRERAGAERLDLQGVAVLVVEQTLQARSGVLACAVRATVDQQATGAANALAAVGGEDERLLALLDVGLVHVVEQLQDGHLLHSVIDLYGLEAALGVRTSLAPDFKCQFHYL